MDTNGIKKHQKNATNYECELCDFKCSKQSEWNRHIMRPKHLNNLQMMKNDNIKPAILNEHFTCDCGNIYNFKSGLYRHKKKLYVNIFSVANLITYQNLYIHHFYTYTYFEPYFDDKYLQYILVILLTNHIYF